MFYSYVLYNYVMHIIKSRIGISCKTFNDEGKENGVSLPSSFPIFFSSLRTRIPFSSDSFLSLISHLFLFNVLFEGFRTHTILLYIICLYNCIDSYHLSIYLSIYNSNFLSVYLSILVEKFSPSSAYYFIITLSTEKIF